MNRRRLADLSLILFGAVVGAIVAFACARTIQLQTGQEELAKYAHRVLENSPHLVSESNRAVATVLDAHLTFCSEEELGVMRKYVYNSVQVKHIGRIRDGVLYCTSGVGRLSPERYMPPHTSIFINGMSLYGAARLVFATDAAGVVVEQNGVSVVFNPDAFKALDEPPRIFGGFLFDPRDSRTIQVLGHPVPLAGAEIAAGRFIERKGVFFQPLCLPREMICVVASQSRASMIAASPVFFRGFLVGGALLGVALGVISTLLYRRHDTLEQQLRRAIQKDRLAVVYQPVIELDSGRVVAAEALVRWRNERGEAVSPDVFVALAERQGFVREITRCVVKKVVGEVGDMLAAGRLKVTINVSSQDLGDPRFFELLDQCLRSAGVKPATIGLEVTERSTADHEVTIDAIARLKRAGYTVYIDDFGTGYSNLAYLHRLAADAIKIDRVFTQTVGTGAATASVVSQILAMANQLGLSVVAEGIETPEQAAYFRSAGRHVLAQGFLFSPGVPPTQLKSILAGGPFEGVGAPVMQRQLSL
jgi:sensor c-di-GMP phosphodiesterase-like protein